jgi:hypothetical protein
VSKLEELQQQHSAVQEDLKSTQSTSEERRLELLQVQLDFTQVRTSFNGEEKVVNKYLYNYLDC